uniref:Uncharacterized protein n=1 Tax=Rhizophora mucronata TaxID=61149 RepID=A0A2P2QHC7_RHIMU
MTGPWWLVLYNNKTYYFIFKQTAYIGVLFFH